MGEFACSKVYADIYFKNVDTATTKRKYGDTISFRRWPRIIFSQMVDKYMDQTPHNIAEMQSRPETNSNKGAIGDLQNQIPVLLS